MSTDPDLTALDAKPIDDGGQAFPGTRRIGLAPYTKEKDVPVEGMSLRDYFAGQALPQGIRAEIEVRKAMIRPPDFDYAGIAGACYRMADAMIAARGMK